jgi:DNA polymerase III epsilon subunit-like protein
MKILLFDTETTGLPRDRHVPAISAPGNWPDIVSLSWMLFDDVRLVRARSHIINPHGWRVPPESTAIHGISDSFALRNGQMLDVVLDEFRSDMIECDVIVAHNLAFDKNVIDAAWAWRVCPKKGLRPVPDFRWSSIQICTAESGKDICKFAFPDNPRRYRFPKLAELYTFLLNKPLPYPSHSSLFDTMTLADIFFSKPLSEWALTNCSRKVHIGHAPVSRTSQSTLRLDVSGGDV